MLTLRTVKGKHLLTYNEMTIEYRSLSEAWAVMFALKKILQINK